MYFGVRVLNALGWAKGDFLLAIGHIFLHRRKNAFALGLLLHVATSVAFVPLYLLVLSKIGFVAFPEAFLVGAFYPENRSHGSTRGRPGPPGRSTLLMLIWITPLAPTG